MIFTVNLHFNCYFDLNNNTWDKSYNINQLLYYLICILFYLSLNHCLPTLFQHCYLAT